MRLAQAHSRGDPEVAIHPSYNHLNHYDEGFEPIDPATDVSITYMHTNHYDEGHHPITHPPKGVAKSLA